ncbi:MAG: peroxide stress protein YaaA [Actinomycetota bacterium]
MLILLPPSEGKTTPERGNRLQLAELSFAELTDTRMSTIHAITALSAKPAKARKALGLGPTQDHLIELNLAVETSPTAPAIEVYTGVLYEALDFASLPARARNRASERLAIASALFGLLRPTDRIPAYRLSADTSLPGLPTLQELWRQSIPHIIAKEPGVIVDMRSGAYVKLGPLSPPTHDRAVTVRVLMEKAGKRTTISHHNKATKGLIARSLLASNKTPRTIDGLEEQLAQAGFRTELNDGPRGQAGFLDVILTVT